MDKILIEEITKNKELMGINGDDPPSNVSVSSDGIVNFWDLQSKKVYRYKLVATTKVSKDIPITVKTIDIGNGTIEYLDPNTNEPKVQKISEEAQKNIVQSYKNKQDINNLSTFKHMGFTVTIVLKFVEEQPLNIK